jgi:NADPH:quinone reductase-like Zn-dependent oxidoreductase
MQAIIYQQYGTPAVLHTERIAQPAPRENEILIRVHATTVNYGDLIARRFREVTSREFNMPLPLYFPARLAFGWNKPRNPVLGSEFSGVVAAIGSAVTRFHVGDAVFGYTGQSMGAYAEYLCMAETGTVTHKPANLRHEEAAALPYGALMALGLLAKVNLQPGQKVLINGASGSIGAAALQLAKHHYGAVVHGVCGTPRIDYVRSLGAERVFDYTREDFTQSAERYDLILDVLGRVSFRKAQAVLTPQGMLMYASFKMPQVLEMLWTSRSNGKKVICALSGESQSALETISNMAETGKLQSIIDRSFPLEHAAEAHRYVEAGEHQGKVVLTI